jgi:hypothetical protein
MHKKREKRPVISVLRSSALPPCSRVVDGELKNDDGEKWSRIFYFEIHQAPSELLLPSAKKFAQKG